MKHIAAATLLAFLLAGCAESSPFTVVKNSPEQLKRWPTDELCYANQYANPAQRENIQNELIRRGVKSFWLESPQAVGPSRYYYCPGID